MDNIQFRPLKVGDSDQIIALFKQLSADFKTEVDFSELVADPKCHCVVACDSDIVVGFGSLVRHAVPSKGEVGRIEDVIIDERYQGKGIGRAMMQELISIANEENITQINLTSSPLRIAARKLYESMGFVKGNTDVFLLKLK